jgi:AcrR family transcriptional regulator
MSRRAYHHGDLRTALIQAALTALEGAGSEELSLRGLAEKAGVSRAAPYAHFADKRALLAAIAATGFQRMTEAMTAVEAGAPARARFMQVGRGYVGFALANPNLFKLMFSRELASLRDLEGLREAGEAAVGAFYAGLSAFLAEARPDRPMTYADQALSWSHIHGLSLLLLEGRLPVAEAQRPELAEEVTTMFVDLLASGQARAAALGLDFTRLERS